MNDNLGGIKGRPLKLTHCESLGTPDSAINCANQAVDAKPDVVIKGVDVAGGSAVPIVTGAGLPYVTLNAGSPDEVDHKLAFSLSSGFAAQFAPVAAYAKTKGYKSLGVIYTNVQPLSTPLNGPFAQLLAKDGISYVPEPVDITAADVTSEYNALVAKHVGAILVVTTLAQCTASLQARSSLSDSTPLFMSSSCNVPSALSCGVRQHDRRNHLRLPGHVGRARRRRHQDVPAGDEDLRAVGQRRVVRAELHSSRSWTSTAPC